MTIVISSFYVGAGYPKQIEKGQAFIKSIVGNYEPIPDVDGMKNDIPATNGMKVLQKVIDLETGTIGNVVLRSITESFWQKVIEATKTSRVCALGTPGIGKSTTTCILIRMLLQQNKTVVYRLRKLDTKGYVYMFVPTIDSSGEVVNVRVIREYDFDYSDTNVNQADIYYVVDPGQTNDNCDLSSDFEGKVIIVASPDDQHWGESEFDKGRGFVVSLNDAQKRGGTQGMFLYYPVWSLAELLASMPYITKDYDIDKSAVKVRFRKFGGVPRYIFTADVGQYEIKQNLALALLVENSGINLAYRDRAAIRSHAEKLPKGILLSYVLSEDDKGSFKCAHATFSSDFVYEAVTIRYMGMLWNKIVPDEGRFDPYLFETYCAILLCDSKVISEINFTARDSNVTYAKATKMEIPLKRCIGREKVYDIVKAARETVNTIFVPISSINKYIDFIYRDGNTYHCFQCTIGATHSANPEHIYKLVLEVINRREDSIVLKDLPHVHIYYAVPDFRFSKFRITPTNAKQEAEKFCNQGSKRRKKGTFLVDHWDAIVSISILKVSPLQSMKV